MNTTSKQLTSFTLLTIAALVAPSLLAGPDEGLVWAFKAKDGVADGSTDMADFRDQLTVSASSSTLFTFADDGVHKPFMTNLTVKSGIAAASYPNQTCLFLDQPTNYIDGVLHSYEQQVSVPNAMLSKSSEGASFFARVKWLGRSRPIVGDPYPYNYSFTIFDNGNDWSSGGWSFMFGAYGGVAGNAWLGVSVAGAQAMANSSAIVSDASQWTAAKFMGSYCDVYAGDTWVDVGVTLRSAPDEGRTYVTLFKCTESGQTVSIGRSFVEKLLAAPSPYANGYIFGSSPAGEHVGDRTGGNFRGAVSEVRLWDRCLDEEEMLTVFAGQQQGWTIGVENGSADEFSDSECVPNFNPRTMSWSGMRKTLTAGNPSVSITSVFPADRRNLPRVLHVRPILSSEAATGAKLDVRLNGTDVGRISLRSGDRFLFIKESVFGSLVGSDGTATFTLTRSGNMTGEVAFDFLELTGSFQLGENNSSYANEFTWGLSYNIFSGIEDTTVCTANFDPNRTMNLRFPLRQAVADHYRFRFSTHLFWNSESPLPLSFAINGVAVSPTEVVEPDRTFHFDFEPGVLREENVFTITSGASTVTEGYNGHAIDYYRLEVVNTDQEGTIIVLR